MVFIGLLLVVVAWAPTPVDRTLAGHLQSIPWGSLSFVPALGSDVGGGAYGFYVFPAMVGTFLAATRRWHLLIPLAAVFLLHFLLISPKLFVTAYRPSPEFGVFGAGGLESFPSGHVQWAVSFYGLLAYFGWRNTTGRTRGAILALYAAVVVLTMLGRIELGRHWPLDTLAGVLVGLISLRVLIALHRWSARKRSPVPAN